MYLKRDSQKIKCATIAHFIFCPIKTHPKSVLKKDGKFVLQRGLT